MEGRKLYDSPQRNTSLTQETQFNTKHCYCLGNSPNYMISFLSYDTFIIDFTFLAQFSSQTRFMFLLQFGGNQN